MTEEKPQSTQSFRVTALDEVQERMNSHPGYVEHLRLDAFSAALNAVFRMNRLSLLTLLRRAATDHHLQMQLMQNVARPDAARAFRAAVITALHNYVAGTITLADHSRRLMKGRTAELTLEYESKKAELLAHPEVSFIKDLRNFMLHRSLPALGLTHTMSGLQTPSPKVDLQVELSTKELLKWHGWSAAAKAYLVGWGEKVPLLPIIDKHGGVVFGFNAWILTVLAEANREALDEVNKIVVERNAILAGTDLETARRATDEWTRRREETSWPPPTDDNPPGCIFPDGRLEADRAEAEESDP